MAREMTERRTAMLQRLALVPKDMFFKCGGNERILCGTLVKLGYAKYVARNTDNGFTSIFEITYSGRCRLEADGLPSKPKE